MQVGPSAERTHKRRIRMWTQGGWVWLFFFFSPMPDAVRDPRSKSRQTQVDTCWHIVFLKFFSFLFFFSFFFFFWKTDSNLVMSSSSFFFLVYFSPILFRCKNWTPGIASKGFAATNEHFTASFCCDEWDFGSENFLQQQRLAVTTLCSDNILKWQLCSDNFLQRHRFAVPTLAATPLKLQHFAVTTSSSDKVLQ